MKNTILGIAVLVTSAIAAQNHKIEIEINGFKNDKGTAIIGLYNTKESFMQKGLKLAKTIVKNKKTFAVFENMPKGIYAVSMFHDENANGKIDSNFVGIPKEGYGTSNDAKGFMGPPKYEDATFDLTSDKKLVINVQ